MLDFIDHKQFNAALLKVQHEFHEQDFLIVALHIGLSAFQQQTPEQRSGRLVTDRSLDANDRDMIALLFDDRQ